MKIEVAVLGSPSLIVLMVSVDVKQHLKKPKKIKKKKKKILPRIACGGLFKDLVRGALVLVE